MEVLLLQTPDSSRADRRSVSAACGHVAVSYFSNVVSNFQVPGQNLATLSTLEGKRISLRLSSLMVLSTVVKLDGVEYSVH